MREKQKNSVWGGERLGLSMIIASLIVIIVAFGMQAAHQIKNEVSDLRHEATSLARSLSRTPYDQLISHTKGNHASPILMHGMDHPSFVYVSIIDTDGKSLMEISRPGVSVPVMSPSTLSSWSYERDLQIDGLDEKIYEFNTPLIVEGEVAGLIRLGYVKPGFLIHTGDIPFFAAIALAIFLLTPFFYIVLNREIRPLRKASAQIDRLIAQDTLSRIDISTSGELKAFMGHFSQYVDKALDRVQQLERELSDRETSGKLLSYKRMRLESVIQSLPDAVMVLDEAGNVCFANTRFSTLLGVSVEDVMEKRPAEWCENHEMAAYLNDCFRRSSRNVNPNTREFTLGVPPQKYIAVMPYPLISPRDPAHILGTLVLLRDVTAENLAKEGSNAFIAQVAHELKSPLNVISMYSETLQGGGDLTEEFLVEAANVIKDESERMTMLINNTLNLTKIEMGNININRSRVKLKDLLQDAFDTCVRNDRDNDLDFKLDLPPEIGPVAVDKELMRIAINNLLTNAIKYNKQGGVVTLSAEETESSVRIIVRDTGIGIDSGEVKKIFEKFYRSDSSEVRKRVGHGMGLALAREIVRLHQGTLSVNSIPNEGSEFTIEFNKEADLLKLAG
jgi:PAS domain S-box-containing protein